MILTVRPALREEAAAVGRTLRWEDAREVEAALAMSPEEGTVASFDASHECYTARLTTGTTIDPNPAVIFGVAHDDIYNGLGVVWLLATDAIKRAPLSILREACHWLDHWQHHFPLGLYNYVDCRNTLHLRWLQYSGFTLGQTMVLNGHPFQRALRTPHIPCVQQHP